MKIISSIDNPAIKTMEDSTAPTKGELSPMNFDFSMILILLIVGAVLILAYKAFQDDKDIFKELVLNEVPQPPTTQKEEKAKA